VAVLGVAFGAAVRVWPLGLLGTTAPFVTFYPAVIVAALYGGIAPGLLATALSALMATFFWMEPVGKWEIRGLADWIAVAVFFLSCASIAWIAEALRRTRARSAAAEAEARLAEERNRSAEAVRHAHEILNSHLEHSPLAVLEWNGEFRLTRWTGGAERMFGWTAAEVLGKHIRELGFAHLEDMPAIDGLISKMLAGEITTNVNRNRNVRKDGAVIDCEWYNTVIRDDSGRLASVLGQALDVTERNRLLAELSRYELLSENTRDIVLYLRREDGRILEANAAAAAAYGYTREELKRLTLHDLRAPEAHVPAEEEMAAAEARSVLYETVHRRRDGGTFPAEVSSQGGTIGGTPTVIKVVRDITERRKIEATLRENEERLRLFIEYAPAAVSMFDREMRYLAVSRRWRTDYGLGDRDILGVSHYEIFPDIPDRWREIHRRCLAGAVEHSAEDPFPRPDGRVDWVRWEIRPWRDAEGQVGGIILFSEVITERKQAEERLRQAQKLESLGLLAGGVAHDFNNLLVGVIGNASLAQELLPPGSPAAELLEGVVKTGEQAAHLTRQMLAYSGKGKFVVEPLDLSALVPEISGLVRPSISKKIAMHFDLAPDLPPIEADRGQVQQVFMNLALNAAEAIGSRDGLISVRTGLQKVDAAYGRLHPETAELPPGEYVFLEVRDTGCGMDQATRGKIFDPFFSTKFTGRGLGLAAVAGILRGHKGAIAVTTAPGQGSCFTVLFPAAAPVPAEKPPVPRDDALQGAGTILVVDDEALVRGMAKKSLERHGYTVLVAGSGMAAIDVFRRYPGPIALVLLDLSMPEMSGEEALPELHKIRPGVKVLVSSGYSEAEAMSVFEGQPVAGFIQKPYTSTGLAEKVKAYLG
jgi:two-component system, cell cycle sensor histidine kinase and response regulator CckA